VERTAYILKIRRGKQQVYRQAHRTVWPELIAEASRAGIRNHSVFMQGRTLFIYLEADSLDDVTKKMKDNPVKMRWDEYMKDFLEPVHITLEEVFHMD